MIPKITRGSRPGDIGAYLHGAKSRDGRDEHLLVDDVGLATGLPGGRVIGGNLGHDGDTTERGWAQLMRAAARERSDTRRPIWQMSLRNDADDRVLTDSEWRDIVASHLDHLGAADRPHVIVRHAADHVHVVMSRVGFDGTVWAGKYDLRRAIEHCRDLEQRLGLVDATTRSTKGRQLHAVHVETARSGLASGGEPASELASRVRDAVYVARGAGTAAFEEALHARGVDAQPRRRDVDGGGSVVVGYAVRDRAADGPWWKLSQLDRRLAWGRIEQIVTTEAPSLASDPGVSPTTPAAARRVRVRLSPSSIRRGLESVRSAIEHSISDEEMER